MRYVCPQLFKFIYLLLVYVCIPVCLYVSHMCAELEKAKEGRWIPWNESYR